MSKRHTCTERSLKLNIYISGFPGNMTFPSYVISTPPLSSEMFAMECGHRNFERSGNFQAISTEVFEKFVGRNIFVLQVEFCSKYAV